MISFWLFDGLGRLMLHRTAHVALVTSVLPYHGVAEAAAGLWQLLFCC